MPAILSVPRACTVATRIDYIAGEFEQGRDKENFHEEGFYDSFLQGEENPSFASPDGG